MTAAAFTDLPQINWLADGQRLHMRHGPIDLIVCAEGGDQKRAWQQAAEAFNGLLYQLTGEIDLLKTAIDGQSGKPEGIVAGNMWQAASALGYGQFVTPMIAVAGAVADYLLEAMTRKGNLQRAYVNNGGDIAVYLADGRSFDVGICADPETGAIVSNARILSTDNIGGIATSGWRGRSHSLGIADAVTVLAVDAAHADVAATLIANAVDIAGHAAVKRTPANELSPDSDLGSRLVTVDVGPLTSKDVQTALSNGGKAAQKLLDQGSISSVFIALQSELMTLTGSEDDTSPLVRRAADTVRPIQTVREITNV